MCSGILWCLSMSIVNFTEVTDGPTAAATVPKMGHWVDDCGDPMFYCDDQLFEYEVNLLCGLVYHQSKFFHLSL